MAVSGWSADSGIFTLPENVTVTTLPALLNEKSVLSLPVKVVDFCQVVQVDSAVLALLLTWSTNIKGDLQVKNIPAKMLPLVPLYSLDTVLNLS